MMNLLAILPFGHVLPSDRICSASGASALSAWKYLHRNQHETYRVLSYVGSRGLRFCLYYGHYETWAETMSCSKQSLTRCDMHTCMPNAPVYVEPFKPCSMMSDFRMAPPINTSHSSEATKMWYEGVDGLKIWKILRSAALGAETFVGRMYGEIENADLWPHLTRALLICRLRI